MHELHRRATHRVDEITNPCESVEFSSRGHLLSARDRALNRCQQPSCAIAADETLPTRLDFYSMDLGIVSTSLAAGAE